MSHRCPTTPPNDAHGLVLLDGCHCAIVGITDDERVAYSYQLLVEHFIDHFQSVEGDDDYDDDFHTIAIEWVEYNVVSAAQGRVVILYDVLD